MNTYQQHALNEFRAAGWLDADGKYADEMQQMMCEQVLELLAKFSDHGHSGFSASYALNLFDKLAQFKAITPLTGEDWEWVEVMEGTFQNRRDSRVFRDADRYDGQPYFIEGIVFYDIMKDEETGAEFKSYYTNGNSHVPVTFPYTPTTEYRERPAE